MIRGLYAATAGMMSMLSRAQTISNNIANVNTPGYREDTLRLTTFPQQLLSRLFAGNSVRAIGPSGLGIVVESTVVRFAQASLRPTENPLDVAIQGEAFFAVETPQGVRYTRDGSFRRNANSQLVTSDGHAVLGADLAPITVPIGLITILPDGEIRRTNPVTGADEVVGRLGMFEFIEPAQLRKQGNNLFEDPRDLAQRVPAVASTIHQGFLESSNVDPVRAAADLMVAQRSYEANARMIQLQDEITSRAVNDVGKL